MGITPPVAIGLPVYNGEKFLAEAIESVLAQDFVDFDFLISDNCSTDSTWEICQHYASQDKRIRLNRHERNMGLIFNWQFVAENTQSPYFFWHASDDLLAPNYVSQCYDFLTNNPDYVLCFSIGQEIDEAGKEIPDSVHYEEQTATDPVSRFKHHAINIVPANSLYGLIRRDTVTKVCPLPVVPYAFDAILMLELVLAGKFHAVGEALRYKRVSTGVGARARYIEGLGPKALLAAGSSIAFFPHRRFKAALKARIKNTNLVSEDAIPKLLEIVESAFPWSYIAWRETSYYSNILIASMFKFAPWLYPTLKPLKTLLHTRKSEA